MNFSQECLTRLLEFAIHKMSLIIDKKGEKMNNMMGIRLTEALEEQARRNSGVGVDFVKKWQELSRQKKLSVLINGKEISCEECGTAVVRWQGVYQDDIEAVPWATVSLRGRGKHIHGSLSPEGILTLQEQIGEAEKVRLAILKGLVS